MSLLYALRHPRTTILERRARREKEQIAKASERSDTPDYEGE